MQDQINNESPDNLREEELQTETAHLNVSDQKEEVKKKRIRMPLWLRKVLHFSLFLLTIVTTYLVGFDSVLNNYVFENHISYKSLGDIGTLLFDPRFLGPTLVYVLALLGFLTAHEFGHYFMCRKNGIKCTLPIYLPNPFIFGTFGAVIRIKSPIRDKKALFDIGIAGPLAGFIVALPILIIGMSQSIVLPASSLSTSSDAVSFWVLGEPLLQQLLNKLIFPIEGDIAIYMSPLAMVGWFACLVTSINLLPVSQLDGGHVFFAVFGRKHYIISITVVIAMVAVALVFQYYGWLIWALLIMLLGLRHPPLTNENQSLGPGRKLLAVVALAIFILCFIPVPIEVF